MFLNMTLFGLKTKVCSQRYWRSKSFQSMFNITSISLEWSYQSQSSFRPNNIILSGIRMANKKHPNSPLKCVMKKSGYNMQHPSIHKWERYKRGRVAICQSVEVHKYPRLIRVNWSLIKEKYKFLQSCKSYSCWIQFYSNVLVFNHAFFVRSECIELVPD